jgi:hypothetical protein
VKGQSARHSFLEPRCDEMMARSAFSESSNGFLEGVEPSTDVEEKAPSQNKKPGPCNLCRDTCRGKHNNSQMGLAG